MIPPNHKAAPAPSVSGIGNPASGIVPHSAFRTPRSALPTPQSAFTMIEIALSLAIIGFALVAIIGVLPTAMNVQKENRQETIIDQDYSVWLDAIRGGGRGYDDLTNYVLSITNYGQNFTVNPNGSLTAGSTFVEGYTYTHGQGDPPVLLTNSFNIVGLLSRPRLEYRSNGAVSNHMVAIVRAMSGSASDKYPQTNQTLLEAAFQYRLIPEILPYVAFDPASTNFSALPGDPRFDRWQFVTNAQANAADLRLTFRWPIFPNGEAGNFRQSFRTMIGGHPLLVVPGTSPPNPTLGNQTLYFFQPPIYAGTK